jgi:hypothetical protein
MPGMLHHPSLWLQAADAITCSCLQQGAASWCQQQLQPAAETTRMPSCMYDTYDTILTAECETKTSVRQPAMQWQQINQHNAAPVAKQ